MGFLDFLFYGFIAVVIIQVLFYVFLFGKFAFSRQKKVASKNIAISVLTADCVPILIYEKINHDFK